MQGARQPTSSKLKGTHKHAAGSLHSQLGTGKLEALYSQGDPADDLI
jgi:hypothetical protein